MPKRIRPLALHRLKRGSVALAVALLAAAALAVSAAEASTARVAGEGDCLNLRSSAGLGGARVTCVPDGALITALDGETATVDGLVWQRVRLDDGTSGWMAAEYLSLSTPGTASTPPSAAASGSTATGASQPSVNAPTALETPPAGGVTVGFAGTTSIEALIAAQPFPVAFIGSIDVTSQRYLGYIVGAPASVQSLTDATLRPDSVVMITRAGVRAASFTTTTATTAGLAAAETPRRLPVPPKGGMSQGSAGTTDPAALVAAQSFAVDIAMALDVPSQQWRSYIPGAPEFVNSLNTRTLRPDTIVLMIRNATRPDPVLPAVAAAPGTAAPVPVAPTAQAPAGTPGGIDRITYYYCQGSGGDGGGWCGHMANGKVVHPGAASCARSLMGQRFRIVGDPNNTVYTCEDTGGGVYLGHRDIWFMNSAEAAAWWNQTAPSGSAQILIIS